MKKSDFRDGEIYVLENYTNKTYYIKKSIKSSENYITTDRNSISKGDFFESYPVPYRHATQLEADYLNYCINKNKWMSLEDFKKINMPSYEIY